MLLAVLLLPVELSAQSRRDKEQTYVLDQPYEVTKITPPPVSYTHLTLPTSDLV